MACRKYTVEERSFIKTFAFGHGYNEITDEFNKRFQPSITTNQIRGYLRNHKILTGRTGRFEKGHIPANKGTHNGGWEPTQFKKGSIPANYKPVGTESCRNNYKKGTKYIYIKVGEPNKWRMKHVVVWEQHNGKVPSGKIVIFLDGDTTNTNISNLAMIDRKVSVRLNQLGLRYNNKDLTITGINLAELIVKLHEVSNNLGREKIN